MRGLRGREVLEHWNWRKVDFSLFLVLAWQDCAVVGLVVLHGVLPGTLCTERWVDPLHDLRPRKVRVQFRVVDLYCVWARKHVQGRLCDLQVAITGAASRRLSPIKERG